MPLPPPKKSLGQCFLIEQEYARRIAQTAASSGIKTVLEIGPGRGILTRELLSSIPEVLAVEIDRRLIDTLQSEFGNHDGFSLRHEDFLDAAFEQILPPGECMVAGNLPYHLVSEVLFKLFKHAQSARKNPDLPWISRAVLMMQKEVAERVAAVPRKKAWGRISVFAQIEAATQYLFTVPAVAFRPMPKVDGGVVQLDFYRLPPVYPADFTVFERMVRYTFQHRRKMLKSSLAGLASIHPFWQEADLDFMRRPETLSCAEWTRLADTVAQAQRRRSARTQ